MRRGAWLLLLVIGCTPGCAARKKHAARLPSASSGGETGLASWYGGPYHGRSGANGRVYDMDKLTAAHRTLAFDTLVRVENLDNAKTVDVRITDRGPFVSGRVIDVSRAAANALGMIGTGTARVRLHVIGAPAVPEPDVFGVQVGAFRVRSNAVRMEAEMTRRYGAAHIVSRPEGQQIWRVLAGSEPTIEQAAELARRIRAERHVPDAFVVRVD